MGTKELNKIASLVLEDGSVFKGRAFGAAGTAYGEVVFNTSMTGYQEMLTDPSYAGQLVMCTYPLIGNYGINERDFESSKVQVAGFVVREHSLEPSHSMSDVSLGEFLSVQGIPGISGIDTRALTRHLRIRGVMMGMIAQTATPERLLPRLKGLPGYGEIDYVAQVSTERSYRWTEPKLGAEPIEEKYRVVVGDYGLKYNILRILRSRGCEVVAMPAQASAEEILSMQPHGIVLSPGPGDPRLLDYAVATARELIGKLPILGICLGNQILGRAFGGTTFKLKFGHRGSNHPVRDLATGQVTITSQNHGYAIDPNSLPPEVEVSHINLNDGTAEGILHRSLPIMGIQYHSEASPGPLDNEHIFDRFLEMVKGVRQ